MENKATTKLRTTEVRIPQQKTGEEPGPGAYNPVDPRSFAAKARGGRRNSASSTMSTASGGGASSSSTTYSRGGGAATTYGGAGFGGGAPLTTAQLLRQRLAQTARTVPSIPDHIKQRDEELKEKEARRVGLV